MKRCGVCEGEKPVTEFWRDATCKDGLCRRCKACATEGVLRWRKNYPERYKESMRKGNAKRRESIRRWEREHSTACVDCGVLTSSGYRKDGNASIRCDDCNKALVHRKAHDRVEAFLRLRKEGRLNEEIGERAGVTAPAVAQALQRSSVARFDDLEWVPSPYFKRGE